VSNYLKIEVALREYGRNFYLPLDQLIDETHESTEMELVEAGMNATPSKAMTTLPRGVKMEARI